MPISKKKTTVERPKSRAEARGTMTEVEAEVMDEQESDAEDLEEWEEEQGIRGTSRRGERPKSRQQAQSRKTTRRQNNSSTHNYHEWNDVRFQGYLGRDGIMFYTNQDGDPWCHFTLLVSRGKGKGYVYVNVTVWDGSLAEYLDANEKYLSGQDHNNRLLVMGRWDMKKSGERYYQGCIADHVEVID